jgi:transcription elongation GreA/GreB family factor
MPDPIRSLAAGAETELDTETAALDALDAAETLEPLPAPDPIRSALPEKGLTVGLHRLLARSLEEAGDDEEADRVLVSVAERLNQAGYWKALARVAHALLVRNPQTAAPLLARARARGGAEAVDDDLLEEAHRAAPRHGFLAWETAEARLARGEEGPARRTAAEALPALVEDKNYETADEAILLLAEGEAGPVIVRSLLKCLGILCRHEAWDRADALLDLAGHAFLTPRGAAAAWPVMKELWRKHPDHERLREAATEVTRAAVAGFPDPRAVLRISEMERPSQPAEVVLARLETVLAYPPGYYARHSSWGIGKIRDNDTETLVIDFPTKPLHRMTVATAANALEVLPPDDLRVQLAVAPEGVRALLKEDPASVIVLALRTLKDGQGTVDDLKRVLVPRVLPATAWTGWWRTAKSAAASDPRIDSRRAYESAYRLAAESDGDEVELPTWNVKRDPMKNLALLDTFLAHYPDETERVLEAYRDRVDAIIARGTLPAETRAAAALWLLRADPRSVAAPEELVTEDFDFNTLSKSEQETLLSRVSTPSAVSAALDSRSSTIRRWAWGRLQSMNAREEAATSVLTRAATRPEAALFLLEEALPAGELGGPDPARTPLLLEAWLDLLERPPRETHQKRALALKTPDSALGRRLAAAPVPEDKEGVFTLRLKRWQGTDRVRFPLLDFLRAVGHERIAEEVEGHRARSAARIAGKMDAAADNEDPYAGDLVVTRPTLKRLEAERSRVGMELKTAIPRAIQKAREHGDLRENAEYKAAKDKQATYAKRFEELESLLNRVRLIEDLKRAEGVALPGTEVRLEAVEPNGGEDRLTLWLLGEGDQDLGPGVVSYKAPVGKSLHGRRVGDEVEVPREGGARRYRILEVIERLP